MKDAFKDLYSTIIKRKGEPMEGSYTSYLFKEGLDKILKKCGEECAETIIAAKNGNKTETVEEISDLVYHILVLMAQQDIGPEDIEAELSRRAQKIGNLKKAHQSDPES